MNWQILRVLSVLALISIQTATALHAEAPLQSSEVEFPDNAPKGSLYQDNKLVLILIFLKARHLKIPMMKRGWFIPKPFEEKIQNMKE